MAINEDARPGDGIEEPAPGAGEHAGEPDPRGGGCLKLGWGCLPMVVAGVGLLPLIRF